MTVESYQQREYPYGAELAHVVGYVSKINDSDLQRLAKNGEEENYAADRNIGKQGIEGYYEKALHGTTGYQEVEVDNHGRVVRLLKEVPPVAGKNLYLTLDLHLQQYIESVLKGQRAAVVVVDPRDGGVLAMVSSPSYDPNPFVKGIGYQAYKSLLENPDRPLINRVTQGYILRLRRSNPIWRCRRSPLGSSPRTPPSSGRRRGRCRARNAATATG